MTSIFEQIKAALAPRLPEVVAKLLPGGRVSGREYVCASLQGDAGTSCSTNLETGKGSDFATGESWGDVIALAAKVWNMRQGEAAQELARLYHIDAGQNAPQPLRQSADFTIILPVPESAPQPPRYHAQHGQASALWRYADGQGRTLGHVTRFETPEGKVIMPLCFGQYGTGRLQWEWKALPEPRPLYNLPSLAAAPGDAPVLLVEGWARPDDLARLRMYTPAHADLHRARLLRWGKTLKPDDRAAAKEAVHEYMQAKVEQGQASNRAEALMALLEAGLEINRAGKDYITVKDPDSGKKLRLKGGMYAEHCTRIWGTFKSLELHHADGKEYLLTPESWTITHGGTLNKRDAWRIVRK